MHVIYLNVAGFYIKLSFCLPPTEFSELILLNNLPKQIKDTLKGFIYDKKPSLTDYEVRFYKRTPLILDQKIRASESHLLYLYSEKQQCVKTFLHISISQFIFLLIRIIQKLLSHRQGFILHSSASLVNNQAYLFAGPPNAGKSTVMTMLNDTYSSLADDSMIIKKESGVFYCYQTPVIEKNYWVKKTSRRYKIGKIFFLRKALYFKTEKITDKDYIISNLSKQLWTDKESLKQQMKYFLEFVKRLNHFYFLYFAKDKRKMISFFQNNFSNVGE